MIESMKIREGLVFTLPIEPGKVVHVNDELEIYIYKHRRKKIFVSQYSPSQIESYQGR